MGRRGPVGFDLDMTLIDSRPAIMAAFAGLARDTATAIDLAAVDSRLGIKLEDEVAFWFPPDQQVAAVACYRRHYVRLAPQLTTIMPGAREAVEAVRAAVRHRSILPAWGLPGQNRKFTTLSPNGVGITGSAVRRHGWSAFLAILRSIK